GGATDLGTGPWWLIRLDHEHLRFGSTSAQAQGDLRSHLKLRRLTNHPAVRRHHHGVAAGENGERAQRVEPGRLDADGIMAGPQAVVKMILEVSREPFERLKPFSERDLRLLKAARCGERIDRLPVPIKGSCDSQIEAWDRVTETVEELAAIGDDELGGARRRRSPNIRRVVGDGDVDLVA